MRLQAISGATALLASTGCALVGAYFNGGSFAPYIGSGALFASGLLFGLGAMALAAIEPESERERSMRRSTERLARLDAQREPVTVDLRGVERGL